jgi:hypothetical protein
MAGKRLTWGALGWREGALGWRRERGGDAIVSWNFKHIVNHKTQMGVKTITAQEGYNDLLIYTPSFLIGDDDDTL